jgi:hypothetical protein
MLKRHIRLLTVYALAITTIGFKLNAYYDHDDDRYGYGQYGEPYNPGIVGDPINQGADIWHNLTNESDRNGYNIQSKNNAIRQEEEERMKNQASYHWKVSDE